MAIPPFLLKLREILDDTRNADVVRWSDDGLSFLLAQVRGAIHVCGLAARLFRHLVPAPHIAPCHLIAGCDRMIVGALVAVGGLSLSGGAVWALLCVGFRLVVAAPLEATPRR
jgi:ABC-type transporter Mla maintaining outer membrane lipid asymmetry permease subunit MlaE